MLMFEIAAGIILAGVGLYIILCVLAGLDYRAKVGKWPWE